ncbi:hypothetical protein VM57_02525 [Stenotrophomonas maltophilia]|uniref:Transmembrane protein n=1 Tax=Stenotrophomonas maltophilia TaxID=40324 RepID=A0A0F5ZPR6_STEMA|nr:hypothetical protein VM57_02525 [Stenotrophomonas maltophilia]
MDERRLKYLYIALAVLFGLPSLFFGGAGACIAVVMGVIGLVSLEADKLWLPPACSRGDRARSPASWPGSH